MALGESSSHATNASAVMATSASANACSLAADASARIRSAFMASPSEASPFIYDLVAAASRRGCLVARQAGAGFVVGGHDFLHDLVLQLDQRLHRLGMLRARDLDR